MKRTVLLTLVITGLIVSLWPHYAIAQTRRHQFYARNNIYVYNPDSVDPCGTSASGDTAIRGNKDYRGEAIFTDSQMQTIQKLQPLYEKGVGSSGVPWQMLAVIHLRESGLTRTNPGNGQGLFQDFHRKRPDLYRPGMQVSDEVFIKQAERAVEIAESKLLTGNAVTGLSKTTQDLKNKDPDTIKLVFMGYNGFASAYRSQAERLGFTSWMDGSPYVMNRADQKRDPTVEPTKSNSSWGQIKTDGGGISYPANTDHGAYVMFAALSGLPSGSGGQCGNSFTGEFAQYSQYDPRWGNLPYSAETFAIAGCGVTSAAMIATTLKKEEITPPQAAAMGRRYGIENPGLGSWGNKLMDLLRDGYKLRYEDMRVNEKGGLRSRIEAALDRGGIILTSGAGERPYRTGGHFVVIYKKMPNGKWLIGDPDQKPGDILKEYDPQLIITYSHNYMGAFYAS